MIRLFAVPTPWGSTVTLKELAKLFPDNNIILTLCFLLLQRRHATGARGRLTGGIVATMVDVKEQSQGRGQVVSFSGPAQCRAYIHTLQRRMQNIRDVTSDAQWTQENWPLLECKPETIEMVRATDSGPRKHLP